MKTKHERQEKIIFKIFQKEGKLSSSQAHRKFPRYSTTPITSIRRAISRLKKQDKLEDTGEKRIGIYGKPERIWQICETPQLKLWT